MPSFPGSIFITRVKFQLRKPKFSEFLTFSLVLYLHSTILACALNYLNTLKTIASKIAELVLTGSLDF